MTRAEERVTRARLRAATDGTLVAVPVWHAPLNEAGAVMDELWTQKAALGEMLRRGEFNENVP